MKRPVPRKRMLCTVGIGLVLTLAGWHAVLWPTSKGGVVQLGGIVDGFVIGLVGMAILTLAGQRWLPSSGSGGTVRKWGRRSSRHDGVATQRTVLRTSSALAARRKTAVLKPSTQAMNRRQRAAVPIRDIATPVARVGLVRVWSPVEDVTLRIGGPRTGKSGELACRIVDAAGAVVATSTRTDLVDLTANLRSTGRRPSWQVRQVRRGRRYLRGDREPLPPAVPRPVWVFNPCGLGGRPSTVTFDPLDGCTSPTIAAYRAADLIAGAEAPGQGHGGDREFWTTQATRVLKALLHAAALGDRNMRDVLRWVADPEAASQEALAHLHGSSESAIAENALQFFTMNERTRTSVTSTIMPALSWLDDADAAEAAGQPSSRKVVLTEAGVDTPPPPASLDVEELISRRGTIYLLGAHDAQVAPLVTALTGHIARVARDMASRMPGGRLDPPLTFALDEAALICPIPLDEWTADMGGRNITIHIAAQSLPQLRKRWGDNGASAILNNAATVLLFGGTRDPGDLDGWAKLIGERDEHVRSYDADGKVTGTSVRRVPVLEASLIANLPERKVVIIRRGMPPAVGRVQWAWKLRAVRVANRTPKPVPAAASTAAEWSPTTQTQTAESERQTTAPDFLTGPAEPGASTA